jgi:hypothetical protein
MEQMLIVLYNSGSNMGNKSAVGNLVIGIICGRMKILCQFDRRNIPDQHILVAQCVFSH